MGFCIEVIDLYVDIECRDCNYLQFCLNFMFCFSLFHVLSGYCLVVMYLGGEMSFEVMSLYVGSGCSAVGKTNVL